LCCDCCLHLPYCTNALKYLISVLIFFLPALLKAQAGDDTTYKASSPAISWAVLQDSGYTFNDIITNKNTAFKPGGLLQPGGGVYWLKLSINNPTGFSGEYSLSVEPVGANMYYYYSTNAKKWLSQATGTLVNSINKMQVGGARHLPMQADTTNTLYVRIDIGNLQLWNGAIKPIIVFKRQTEVTALQDSLIEGWAAAFAVIFCFFLGNLYVYYSFRDKTVLFYLVAQVGAIFYITTYRRMFPFYPVMRRLARDGEVSHYDINILVMHAAIILIIVGFIGFTRSYLNTRKYMPRLDAILKYGMYFYTAASIVLILINSFWFLIDDFTLIGDNLYLCLLISVVLYTGIRGYKLKLRASGTFLLANFLTLGLSICITLYHVFITMNENDNAWLPNLTVSSVAFAFSIALVARTTMIREDLKAKQLEAQQLLFELKEIGLQHSLVELENQKINSDIQHEKTRNELLQQLLETNQRELASVTLYMVQKNELLAKLKAEIAELNKLYPSSKSQGMSGIQSILQTNLYLDDDWAKFKLHFEQVHPHFFEELQAKHPTLTKNEIRLYAYFHINLSTKEIASLLNIAPASVRRAKTRLFKKMGRTDDLTTDDEAGEDDN